MEIAGVEKSAIYRIEYTDSDPVRAVTTVNGVAEELTRYYRETSTARFDDDLELVGGGRVLTGLGEAERRPENRKRRRPEC